jgi:hypothetical protein
MQRELGRRALLDERFDPLIALLRQPEPAQRPGRLAL